MRPYFVYLPRIPRRGRFSTDSAFGFASGISQIIRISRIPPDKNCPEQPKNILTGAREQPKSNLLNLSAQSASVELVSALICASARENPENQINPWKIRPSVESVGNFPAELERKIKFFLAEARIIAVSVGAAEEGGWVNTGRPATWGCGRATVS